VSATTTTIRGVSILSRQRRRKADVFDIALSPGGIVIRRPGRVEQHMAWDRISQWEIEERPGCVVLTLRGGGSVTPLAVKGWTLDDLETVMREATESTTGPDAHEEVAPAAPTVAPEPAPVDAAFTDGAAVNTGVNTAVPETGPVQPRALRRKATRRRGTTKLVVTVALLGLAAAAVTLVLLQSAGVISWGFLGPTA
jgi:hypothetical protein